MMQRKVSAVFMTAMAMLMMVGYCHGRDERSNAREQIRRLKASISQTNSDISTLSTRLIAGEVLIKGIEIAIDEAKKQKEPNQAGIIALELSLAVAKGKKNELTSEKTAKEQSKRDLERNLAEWEAYLRKLGG